MCTLLCCPFFRGETNKDRKGGVGETMHRLGSNRPVTLKWIDGWMDGWFDEKNVWMYSFLNLQ